jgi:hypothetical protein
VRGRPAEEERAVHELHAAQLRHAGRVIVQRGRVVGLRGKGIALPGSRRPLPLDARRLGLAGPDRNKKEKYDPRRLTGNTPTATKPEAGHDDPPLVRQQCSSVPCDSIHYALRA